MSFNAGDMASKLRKLCNLLIAEELITPDSVPSFEEIISELLRNKTNTNWRYSFTKSEPVTFATTSTKRVKSVTPTITIQVECNIDPGEENPKNYGFRELNTTLELLGEKRDILMRWHIDLANEQQPGPLFHLQAGGHSSGNAERANEIKLDVPRWMHPPMDLILMCEFVVANFYPDVWRKLCGDQSWLTLIKESEAFCYKSYLEKLAHITNTSGQPHTLLQTSWI